MSHIETVFTALKNKAQGGKKITLILKDIFIPEKKPVDQYIFEVPRGSEFYESELQNNMLIIKIKMP
ncbi:MAG: hypothetical protein ACOC4B_00820 [Bacteroidota bacterium]